MSMLIEGVDMPRGTNMMLLITPDGDVWEMGDLLGDDKLIDGAKAVPAADVREVNKSKWFDGACINCGFKPVLDYEYATVYDDHNEYRWRFCPNCGARMVNIDG